MRAWHDQTDVPSAVDRDRLMADGAPAVLRFPELRRQISPRTLHEESAPFCKVAVPCWVEGIGLGSDLAITTDQLSFTLRRELNEAYPGPGAQEIRPRRRERRRCDRPPPCATRQRRR